MRKSYRVKTEADFQKVFQTGNSKANRNYVVYQLEKPGQKHFRVGISVGKRVGNAVHRNQVKRRIRQGLQDLKPRLRPDVDFLVIARPRADRLTQDQAKANLIHVLTLAGLLTDEVRE
ncbi:ribonuclease P protein component [Loigolactobacillus rennini]|uniref:Ribonuclease P protein component n=2 Tax=Loigolactobacillus rennini TaxID=238013 RepID=A0A0R2CSR1_9LACO|nr:ribonuclease P protein component [Loigolactobacillus rennini]KRM94663.1 ribonuclease P [Loigolactobacillus rennini DSM 20253]SFZ89158.1 Ribonuclease P protein component [Loigolactobacillus rennini]